jgi:hypothetical protein
MKRLSLAVAFPLVVFLLVSAGPTLAADARHNGTALPVPRHDGVVPWKTLAEVGEVTVKNGVLPRFSEQILALDRREIRLQGFMLPLDPGKMQKRFLLSANVPTCPFCLPGGPESLIEVLCRKPIAFSTEPMIVSGTLSVLRDDPNGLWYRLTEASLVSTGM